MNYNSNLKFQGNAILIGRSRDLQEKMRLAQKLANNKNPQFLPNHADIKAILPTHELVIFTKFHKDWVKIMDFSIKACFWVSNIFFASVSSCENENQNENENDIHPLNSFGSW